ncbi:MAG TPA: MarR family winged helix-turn-helix transcriptional regulator [Polyangia bacterium]|jgi:DNA-binding MarR family transcriptional regulator
MRLRTDVAQVFRDYPRIYFACHRRHVRDPKNGAQVSARQVSILDHLDADAPTMLADLADHLGVTSATMSIAVAQLVDHGYVTRVLDPVDRRKVQLRLTDAGVRICAANSVLEPTLVEEMLDQLSVRDRKAALQGLALLGEAAVDAQHARARAAKQKSTATKRGSKSA